MLSRSFRSAAGSSGTTARSGCMARACASAGPGANPSRSAAAETATRASTLPRLAETARGVLAPVTSPLEREVVSRAIRIRQLPISAFIFAKSEASDLACARREGGISSAESNRHPPPHLSPMSTSDVSDLDQLSMTELENTRVRLGEGGECGSLRVTPPGDRSPRLTRSVESRFSHRLTMRWRIETLFHTIELQHPFSERAAAVAEEADGKPRRTGTERHLLRSCAGAGRPRRTRRRRADAKARPPRGGVVPRGVGPQERQRAAPARRQRKPA